MHNALSYNFGFESIDSWSNDGHFENAIIPIILTYLGIDIFIRESQSKIFGSLFQSLSSN